MTTQTKQRYDYLDIAKGLGILAVVWAHIMLTGWSHRLIYAFHMPLFFFISGMLFRKDKYESASNFLKHRFLRLFIPYIAYSVATWLVWVAFRMIRHDEVASYWMPLAQTFISQGSGAFMVHNSALWFIPCLFATEIMYFFLSNMKEWTTLCLCILLAAVSFILGSQFGDDYWMTPPWNFDAALIALPFYCLGNMLTRHFSHKQMNEYAAQNKVKLILTTIVLTILLVLGAEFFGECSMGSSSYQCNGFIFMTRAIIGCASMIAFSLLMGNTLFGNNKVMDYVKYMGRTSLDVMCLHIPVKGVAIIGVGILLHSTVDDISNNFGLSAIAFIITMIVVTICIAIIQRLFYSKK